MLEKIGVRIGQVGKELRITVDNSNDIDYINLLQATQEKERRLIQKKNQQGYKFFGCGGKADKIIQGGTTEHVLEHAICANLEDLLPADANVQGLTYLWYMTRGKHGEAKPKFVISIMPPSTVDLDMTKSVVENTIKEIFNALREGRRIHF